MVAAGGGSLVTAGGSRLVAAGVAGVLAGVLVAVRLTLELAFMTGGAPASAVAVGVLATVVVGPEATRLHHRCFVGRRRGPLASQSPNQGDRTQEHNRGSRQGSDHGASPVAHKPRNN
jgi:hypothetical protein